MGKNHVDRSQSLARVSSASTETDYIPATVPFDWETAPGRSAAAAEREIIELPSLPLPPGRRPKDGFFLPISRSVQRPNLLNEEGVIDSSPKERRPFNLKFPGSSKKALFKSRKQRKIRKDADCVEDTGSVFNPLSAHRLGSRITRRVLVESQKSPSCFGQCLPVGRKASSSHIGHHRGRGLDDVEDLDVDGHYATPRSSASLGSPLSQSPRHGHGKMQDSSITGAGKQLQVKSSRFNMASMLIALLPSESDGSDEYHQAKVVDGGHEIIEDNGGETPRSSCGSSDFLVINNCSLDNPKSEVETGSSPSVCVTPIAEPSTLRRDSFEEGLEPNQPTPKPPTSSLPQSPLQNHSRLQIAISEAFKTKNIKVPSNSPLWLQELKSSSLWPNRAQEMYTQGDASNQDKGYESGEDSEHSSTDSIEYRTLRTGSSTLSMNSPVLGSLNTSPKPATWVVSEEVLKSSPMFQRKLQRQQSHESPQSSFMLDEETTAIPSPNITFAQNSDIATGQPTYALDECHVNSPDCGSRGEDLAELPITVLSGTSGFEEMNKGFQEESKAGVGSFGKSFPIYLRRRGSAIIIGKTNSSDDGSGEDSDSSSTKSFEHATPRAVLPGQSRNLPILCKFNVSLEPETWVVSEEFFQEVLKAPSSLQCKLQRQLQMMGLQTKSLHGANHFENRSTDSFEHRPPRVVSLTPSLNSPIFSKFNISLEPESWLVYEVYEEKHK